MAITKEVWILPELWREIIKPCLFHNIKTQGKHLKNDTYIKKYNEVIKSIPRKYNIKRGNMIRIIYNSATNSFRITKMFYMVPHPRAIKTKSPGPYNLIVECPQYARRLHDGHQQRVAEEYERGGINTLWHDK